MLELRGITKRYKGETENALDGIDLSVEAGEFVAVLGRSGAGKSTLIRCINRLVEPDAGSILWNGKAVTGMNAGELRRIRGEIGMVFQHFNLIPRLSVLTNVMTGRFAAMPRWRSLLGLFSASDRERAMSALREVGLERFASRRSDELSGGQKQRVAIARVLMQRPALLLGDEPLSSLDAVTAKRVLSHISRLHRELGITVVLNLHDVEAARSHASRIVGIHRGQVVYDGTPDRLGEAELQLIYPADDDEAPESGER